MNEPIYNEILSAAETLGNKAGRDAAKGWVTTRAQAQAVLDGIEMDDPEEFPTLDLSGEWADGPTPRNILDAIAGKVPHLAEHLTAARLDHETAGEFVDAYADAFDAASAQQVEWDAQEILKPESVSTTDDDVTRCPNCAQGGTCTPCLEADDEAVEADFWTAVHMWITSDGDVPVWDRKDCGSHVDWAKVEETVTTTKANREGWTALLLSLSLCPLHECDYAICFDDEDSECAAIRAVHPGHDT